MSALVDHARRELELSGVLDKDGFYGGMAGEAVLELVEVFSKQGHSGASAPLVVSLFSKVANYETITSLTGLDDEWVDVSEFDDSREVIFQNMRNGAVFKEGKDGKPYFLDAIVFRNQDGCTFTRGGRGDRSDGLPSSAQYIKSFPFKPVKFYVDVIETEEETTLANPLQLDEVWEYYDRITSK